MNDQLRRAPIGVLEATPDGTVTAINETAGDLLGVDAAASTETPIDAVFPDSVDNAIPAAFGDGASVPEERSIEEYYPELDRWLSVSIVPTDGLVTVYLADESAHRDRRRANERLEDELDRLTVLNELIAAVLADLVEASTRTDIAETVCEHLGETDIYEFAWFGERRVGGDEIAVRASAGATGRTFDRIEECLGADAGGDLPERRAIETATPQVSQPIPSDRSVPKPVRRGAFADGVQSLLAIPLTYGSSVYGVIGVYAADKDGFSERERSVFATVGSIAGFAVNAARNRTLLLSDAVVELTLRVADAAAPLVATADDVGGEFVVEGLVSQEDGAALGFLRVEGVSPDRLAGAVAEDEPIALSRVINESDAGGLLEVELGGRTSLGTLLAHGATVRSANFDPDRGRITVELPPEEEIRRIIDAASRRFDVEVLAKREEQREIQTVQEFRDTLRDRLTERQETVLRTAFLADYFESPRGSTAEEVADSLGITAPTLLHHLRASQRKLLEEFFETAGPEPPGVDR